MKIGFYSGSLRGSGKTTVTPLAKGLARRGHEVYVMETKRYPPRSETVSDEITYHYEPTLEAVRSGPISIFRRLLSTKLPNSDSTGVLRAYDVIHGRCVANFAQSRDLDVLYLFHNDVVAPYLPESIEGTKVAVNLIGFGIDEKRGGKRNTFPYQDYLFARPSWHTHFTATNFEYSQYESVYRRLSLNTERLHYLPHSVDSERFHADVPPDVDRIDLPDAGTLMTYPVHVYPRKNVELGIRVVDALASETTESTPSFVVTGEIFDEEYRERLRALASKLGVEDSVHFLGGVPRSEMPDLLRESDLVLFPSHQETFGIGIVEALACGTPVVGPNYIHATREVLESVTGGYAAAKSVESFRKKVEQVVESSQSPEEISRQALSRYGNDHVAGEFERIVTAETDPLTAAPSIEDVRQISWADLYTDVKPYDLRRE